MAELGLNRTDGTKDNIASFRNQATRLFASAVYCRYSDETKDKKAKRYIWRNPMSYGEHSKDLTNPRYGNLPLPLAQNF